MNAAVSSGVTLGPTVTAVLVSAAKCVWLQLVVQLDGENRNAFAPAESSIAIVAEKPAVPLIGP